jgi:hypothetical protein
MLRLPLSYLPFAEEYGIAHRLSGFFNEGGPYGLYVMTVLLVGIALYRLQWESKRRVWLSLGLLSIVFILSYSKAAALAAVTLLLINGLFAGSLAKKIIILGSSAIVLFIFTMTVDIGNVLVSYRANSAAYEQLSHLHDGDPSFVQGRVAGAFIVPRMIAAHPWTGVGWGNYGLLRNDPAYRGASVWFDNTSDPALGILSLTAELGFPLFALILLCLIVPYIYLRRIKAPIYLTNLAMAQPLCHFYGAQLNITYPWIVAAMAMGVAFSLATPEQLAPLLGKIRKQTTEPSSGSLPSLTPNAEGTV